MSDNRNNEQEMLKSVHVNFEMCFYHNFVLSCSISIYNISYYYYVV